MAVGTLPPELFEQQQQLNRQQQMAQLLMQQGQQMPQSQMVSGRYVAPSIFQNLAPLFQTYMGQKLSEKSDKQALELAAKLRQRYGDEVKEFRNLMQGREQLAPEQAGPTQTGQPIPQEMVRSAPNVQGAYDFAASAYNPALQAAGLRKLTEGPMKVGAEDVLLDPVTMQPIFKGAGKTTSEMQNYNFAKTPEGGGFTGSFNEYKNQITPYQQAQLGMEREKFEFEKTKSAVKPLPEGLNKQVTGSINLSDAITDYQSKIKGFGVQDFANPNKRAEMGNAYNNMMLQAKEAYNLGVLNGPDYEILQKVVRDPTNPSSLLFSNKALDRQAESLRTTAKNISNTAYISQGRDVPADIAKKLVKPEVNKPLQSFNTDQDVQQAIQAGILKKGDKVTVNGVTGTIQ
jgi:hypothetical protein